MEMKGAKRMEITGISDKQQITALFCGTLDGCFLAHRIIYQGKTSASFHNFTFSSDSVHLTGILKRSVIYQTIIMQIF